MTWLACISHYVRGHVHKSGQNCNGTEMKIKRKDTGKRKGGGGSLSLPFSFFPHRLPFRILFTFPSPRIFRVFPTVREIGTGYWPADCGSQRVRGHSKCKLVNLSQRQRRKTIERRLAAKTKTMSKIFVGSRISTCFPSRQRHQAMFSSLSTVFITNCQKSSDAQRVNKYIYKREQIIFLANIYNASNMEVFDSSLNLQCIWDRTAEKVISAFLLEATHRIQRKNVITRIMPLQQLN